MAKIGTTPPANLYDGISTGPSWAYSFETQSGIPVDGTDDWLRQLSPFTIRMLPPEVLLSSAALLEQRINQNGEPSNPQNQTVSIITEAAKANDGNNLSNILSNSLSTSTLIDTPINTLQSYVSNGSYFTNQSTGYRSTIIDSATAADIALQLRSALSAPPLTLLINPTSMNTSYSKIQSFSSRGRDGYIFEAWGEEQPRISFSCTTAGFVAGVLNTADSVNVATSQLNSVSGYHSSARRDSASWQNFMALYTHYRNNGYIYDTLGQSKAHLFVGSIAIDYDQWTYIGHFESFTFSFDEATPHRIEFEMEFVVSQAFDWASAPTSVSPLSENTSQSGARPSSVSVRTSQAAPSSPDTDIAQTPLILFA